MTQKVVLCLGSGNLHSGFPSVIADLWKSEDAHPIRLMGQLPAAPELRELYRSWQLFYKALNDCLGLQPRIEIEEADITNVSRSEFTELCQRFIEQMNAWLNSEQFRQIDQPLRTHLNPNDEIQVLIATDDLLIQQLPWHQWTFLDHYPKAEIALSAAVYEPPSQSSAFSNKVRILAIFGNSKNINLGPDQTFLKQQLSDQANIEYLFEPHHQDVNDGLWQQWDMLFFAGHSYSSANGVIQINATESLTLNQLRYALKHAIAQGLKLAIFNSCDGLGLARDLADLNIPQIIVMRELVPDAVAHTFLKHFLIAFSQGQSLYASVREARERLQGLESQFPCATWLPMICQNPAVPSTNWWPKPAEKPECEKPAMRLTSFRQVLKQWLLATIATTGIVMGLRSAGFLQAWELSAFDTLMRSRPTEPQDPRLLIVTITEHDFQLPEQRQREGSVSDLALIRLLDKLEPYQPRAIGLDIYRDSPMKPELNQRLRQSDRFFAICKGSDSKNNDPGIAPPSAVPQERQGFSDVIQDPDGVLRRHLVFADPDPASPCTTEYAFSTQLALHYLAEEGITVSYPDDQMQFGSVRFKRFQNGVGGYQRVDPWGYQILLNYRSHQSPLNIAPTVTLGDVLAGKVTPELVKDRIVLIGVVAKSGNDYLPTPYSISQNGYQEMPGVIVQAQMLSQLLSAVKDGRTMIKPWLLWQDVLWIWCWAAIGGAIAFKWRSPFYLVLAVGSTIGILSLLCWGLFIQGAWAPWVPASLVILSTSGTIVISRFSSYSHSGQ
jgi:CHASE2 domain-containing sensor protein